MKNVNNQNQESVNKSKKNVVGQNVASASQYRASSNNIPQRRKYLTPEEVASIQDLDIDEYPVLKEVRDKFLLQCYLGVPFDDCVEECEMDFYCHGVGLLLYKAGIAKTKKEGSLLYYLGLAHRTFVVNTRLYGHVLANR